MYGVHYLQGYIEIVWSQLHCRKKTNGARLQKAEIAEIKNGYIPFLHCLKMADGSVRTSALRVIGLCCIRDCRDRWRRWDMYNHLFWAIKDYSVIKFMAYSYSQLLCKAENYQQHYTTIFYWRKWFCSCTISFLGLYTGKGFVFNKSQSSLEDIAGWEWMGGFTRTIYYFDNWAKNQDRFYASDPC